MSREEESPSDIFYYAGEGALQDLEKTVKNHKDWLSHIDHRGRNALFHAAIADNQKNFQFLVKKGLSYWEQDHLGATALHWAVQCGSAKIVRLYLTQRYHNGTPACLVKDKDGVTPFHVAASLQTDKILKLFVESLSLEDMERVPKEAKDVKGRTPLHYAASRASLDCVTELLNSTQNYSPDPKDMYGLTPLMCAAGVPLPPAVEVCRLLVNRKPLHISSRNRDGQTALHLAVAANCIDIVNLLVNEFGTTQNDNLDNEGRCPLHYAAEQDHLDIVRLLLAAKTVDGRHTYKALHKDKFQVTAAHYAAQFSCRCLTEILQASGAQQVRQFEKSLKSTQGSVLKDQKDSNNRTCLMWAVIAGNQEVVENMVRKSAPSRHEMDTKGFTALHLAAMMGNVNLCKYLVSQGWSTSERDMQDNTPLHLAAGRGKTDVVRYLVTAGANINDKDALSRSPIFFACFGGQGHTLNCMITELGFQWRTAEGMAQHEAKPITDSIGRTPLHAAAYAGYSICINTLLQIENNDDCLKYPLVGWKDIDGDTALHVACRRGRVDCVLALIKGGAAINGYNNNELTPLDCAIQNNHLVVVENLKTFKALTCVQLFREATKTIVKFLKAFKFRNDINRRIEERKRRAINA